MLYLTVGMKSVVIIEAATVEKIRAGKPAVTPDKKVVIAYTPDPVWLAEKLMECDGRAETICRLIDESAKRQQKPADRPYHPPHKTTFKKAEDEAAPKAAEQPVFTAEAVERLVEWAGEAADILGTLPAVPSHESRMTLAMGCLISALSAVIGKTWVYKGPPTSAAALGWGDFDADAGG